MHSSVSAWHNIQTSNRISTTSMRTCSIAIYFLLINLNNMKLDCFGRFMANLNSRLITSHMFMRYGVINVVSALTSYSWVWITWNGNLLLYLLYLLLHKRRLQLEKNLKHYTGCEVRSVIQQLATKFWYRK